MKFPAGFRYKDEFITRDEEQGLIGLIHDVEMVPTTVFVNGQSVGGDRLQKYYGWNWNWSANKLEPAEKIPNWLLTLRGQAARFADVTPESLVQAALLRYNANVKANWHRDKDNYQQVIGISLGSSAEIAFRRPRKGDAPDVQHLIGIQPGGLDGSMSKELKPRSIYHLVGEVREEWMHEIRSVTTTRWAIMFRDLRVARAEALNATPT